MSRKLFVPQGVDWIDNPHHAVALKKFLQHGDQTALENRNFLFLCFTNRCSSNYIAKSIASDGQLNVAGEFFNADTIRDEPIPRIGFLRVYAWIVHAGS